MQWKIKPLSSKHYGTEYALFDDDGDELYSDRVWIGFIDYTNDEVSPREKDNGWNARDDGYDHVESIHDLKAAKLIVDTFNNSKFMMGTTSIDLL